MVWCESRWKNNNTKGGRATHEKIAVAKVTRPEVVVKMAPLEVLLAKVLPVTERRL